MAKAMKAQPQNAQNGVKGVQKKQKVPQVQNPPMKKQKVAQPQGKTGKIKGTRIELRKGGGAVRVCSDGKEFPAESTKACIKHLRSIGKYVEPVVQGVKTKKKGVQGPQGISKKERKAQKLASENDPQVQLNGIVSRLKEGQAAKGDITYEQAKVSTPQGKEGFQVTAKVPCLGGRYATMQFVGEVKDTAKDAGESAAAQVIQAISGDAKLQQKSAAAEEALKSKKFAAYAKFLAKKEEKNPAIAEKPWFQKMKAKQDK